MPSNAKILVVDDEEALVDLCKKILESVGFTVRGAISGDQALHMVFEEMPDLILLDVMMPEMDGIEVCREIRKTHPEKRPYIVMYTADNREETRKSSLKAGANDLITKATPIYELPSRINEFLDDEVA